MQSRFGAFVRDRRLALGSGLRKFCLDSDIDPALLSKLERGRIKIPGDDFLEKLAAALQFEGEEKREFMDLAHAESGRVPPELLQDEEVVALLPAVFRTFRSRRAEGDNLEKLIEILKKS